MFMRPRWGLSVILFSGITALSVEAFSRQLNPGLIGGAAQETPNSLNPLASGASMVPRAFILGNDPFAGAEFAACEQKAAMEESTAMAQDMIKNPDFKTHTSNALGGMLGGMISGQGAQSGLQASFSGGACIDQTITANESPPLECEAYKTGDKFDVAAFEKEIAEQEQASSIAACKVRSAKKAGEMTGCFAKEFDNLMRAMQEVKKDFDKNIEGMEKYVSDVQAAVQKEEQKRDGLIQKQKSFSERVEQVSSFLARINGAATGKPTGADGTVTSMQQGIDEHRGRIKAFEEARKVKKANSVAGCMRNGGASTSQLRVCPNANADLLSPKDCILSVYKDSILRDLAGGGNRFSNADKRKAEVQTKIFSQRLEQMLNDFNTGRVQDMASFKSKYGGELNGLGLAGNQMLTEINNCATEAETDIERQLKDPASGLGTQLAALNNEAQTISSGLGAMLNDLDRHIRDTGRDMFGKELNQLVDGFGCHQVTVTQNAPRNADGTPASVGQVTFQNNGLQKQMDCVNGLNATLRAMLNGTPPPGTNQPLQVPLNVTDVNGRPVRCQGLRDCADVSQKLADQSTQRLQDMTGEGTFQDPRCPNGCPGIQKFRKEANQQIRTALQTAADFFTARVGVMKGQMERLKGLLGKVGIDALDEDVKKIDMEQVCPVNPNEICKPGKDFDKLLAGLAGVPNIDSDVFKDAKRKARSVQEDAEKESRVFSKNVDKVRQALANCQKKMADDKINKKLAKAEGKLKRELAKCKRAADSPDRNSAAMQKSFDDILALGGDLRSICEETGNKSEICSNFDESEYTDECKAVATAREDKKQEREEFMAAMRGSRGEASK